MMIGGGENDELISAPALAEVSRRYCLRPAYHGREPIAIEPDLWHQAQTELKASLDARGWPLVADAQIRQPNFLLHGVPVVMSDG